MVCALRIGDNPGAVGREREGDLDDLAIWSRPITADEVTLLANALNLASSFTSSKDDEPH
jgi:hypothetical protein